MEEAGIDLSGMTFLEGTAVDLSLVPDVCDKVCQGRLSSHLQTSAVTDVRTPPHRLLTWHRSRPKGTKGLLEGSGVRVRVRWK